MLRSSTLVLVFLLHSATAGPQSSAQIAPGPVEGAWKVVQLSLTLQGTTQTNDNPRPGLFIFTKSHYSLMYLEGQGPRPLFKVMPPSDSEKLGAFDEFIGHSGTYTIAGSVVEMKIVVSKNPNMMGTDLARTFARFEFQRKGNTLTLTRRGQREVFAVHLAKME